MKIKMEEKQIKVFVSYDNVCMSKKGNTILIEDKLINFPYPEDREYKYTITITPIK